MFFGSRLWGGGFSMTPGPEFKVALRSIAWGTIEDYRGIYVKP